MAWLRNTAVSPLQGCRPKTENVSLKKHCPTIFRLGCCWMRPRRRWTPRFARFFSGSGTMKSFRCVPTANLGFQSELEEPSPWVVIALTPTTAAVQPSCREKLRTLLLSFLRILPLSSSPCTCTSWRVMSFFIPRPPPPPSNANCNNFLPNFVNVVDVFGSLRFSFRLVLTRIPSTHRCLCFFRFRWLLL